MLPSELSWATFASLLLGVRCANEFSTTGTGAFPSEFGQNERTTVFWENRQGYIAGIYLHQNGQSDDSSDYNWIIAPNCQEGPDSNCIAHQNTGWAEFNVTKRAAPLGSGYQLRLLWTNSTRYDDLDDDTEEVASPSFSVVPADSIDRPNAPKGLGTAEKAGIAVAVVVVVLFLLVVLGFRWRKARRNRLMAGSRATDGKDEEKASWHERLTPGPRGTDTDESRAAGDLPAKPSPAAAAAAGAGAGAGVSRAGHKARSTQAYLDDKAEMPADADNRHEIDSHGTSAARDKAELDGTSAPLAPVELPADPVGADGSTLQSRTASTATSGTVFEYNPNPSYALQPPDPDAGQVSPVSEGAGTYNSLDHSVSPVTPIPRKPVGGGARSDPSEQPQQQWRGGETQDEEAMGAGDVAPDGGKTATTTTTTTTEEKSRVLKMLGGGSTKGRLAPASGAGAE